MEDIPVPLVTGGRYVFHVDANSAFLSWSASYRVNVLGESGDLRLVPSIVGGDQEKRHGIVLAKSIPAKRYGIHTGEAVVTARQKCPCLKVIPPDYGLYVKASRAFLRKIRQYCDKVIPFSIDEAWAVFDGFEELYGHGQMVGLADRLRREIREELGFTVNIGVSTNFLLSKMAGEFSKPDRVHTLFPEEIEEKLWPLPVSELFFVGKATASKLHRLGILTVGELAAADEALIRAHLKLPGKIIQGYARGGDLEPYLFTHDVNKGYGNSMTAPVDVETEGYGVHLLLSLCETVGSRLREDNVTAGTLSVHITTNEFEHYSRQMQLSSATNVTEELYRAACLVLGRLWDKRTPIRQLGVHASGVCQDAGRQYNLFDLQRPDRLEALDRTVDAIRRRYGEDSVKRACFLKSNIPHMGGGLDRERRSGVTVGIDVEKERTRII